MSVNACNVCGNAYNECDGREDCPIMARACVSCPNVYEGGLECPVCSEPGEPLKSAFDTQDTLDTESYCEPVSLTCVLPNLPNCKVIQ